MSLLTKGGIERLSELIIDADKDWQAYGITNVKELAAAMGRGDMVVRGDDVLQRLPPGIAGHVLVSAGFLQIPAWSPVPGPAALYFPVWAYLLGPVARLYAPDHLRELSAPITSPHDETTVATKTPVQTLATPAAALYTPDHAVAKGAAAEICFHTEVEDTAVLAAMFGYNSAGLARASIADMIRGSRYRLPANATATSIDAYIQVTDNGGGVDVPVKCAMFSHHITGGTYIMHTLTVDVTAGAAAWINFPFFAGVGLTGPREYWLVAWAEDIVDMEVELFYDAAVDCSVDFHQGFHLGSAYNGFPDSLLGWTTEQAKYSIRCNY